MKGNEEVINYLNEVLKAELTAIHQYFLHSKMCENWGFSRLGNIVFREALGEMEHAKQVMERILFLDGHPNMQDMAEVRVGRTVKEQLENDLALELEAIPRLNAAIAKCQNVGDNGSRELFQRILDDEEMHVDFLEAQLSIIEQVGIANYLSQQMRPESAGDAALSDTGGTAHGH